MKDDLYPLKFPIGEYDPPGEISKDQIDIWIDTISELPSKLADIASMLGREQLNAPYRPGGWTGKQVIHHLADSHINSYMRFKLALTEDVPAIRPYDEQLWAELPDAKDDDVQSSLELIRWLHFRWVKMLRNMSARDWERTFFHPESKSEARLDWNVGMYAWHGEHHLGHLRLLLQD